MNQKRSIPIKWLLIPRALRITKMTKLDHLIDRLFLMGLISFIEYYIRRISMYVITGGGSGLGRALTHHLALKKQSVLVVGRREEKLVETSAFSPLIEYLTVDVATIEGRDSLVNYLKSAPRISGLVNNAGIIDPICRLENLDVQEWRKNWMTNVEAPLFLTQALSTQLKEGRVLNIGSGAAYFPTGGWTAYCVSKAALSMLTRMWQLESKEVAITSVMPGIVETEMMKTIRKSEEMDADKSKFFQELKTKNQLISPEVVACFLSWLLLKCNASTYISQEWDIYDTTHHMHWLPRQDAVPTWDEQTD